jgi:subtilisin family serine protease
VGSVTFEAAVVGSPQPIEPAPAQVPSNGVLRIDGDLSSTVSGDGSGAVDVDIAVLDTGIAPHQDLTIAGGVDCVGDPADPGHTDANGHGTMVAGFAAANDDAFGRVGVAPGARLWAVKVLNPLGYGDTSNVICGLDWVLGTRLDADPANDVEVANMSLAGRWRGRPFPDDDSTATYHLARAAIRRLIDAGVTIVAAAGNEARNFSDLFPAAFPEVLTVAAIADKDGQPGGLGGTLNCLPSEVDDTAATFSNFAGRPRERGHLVAAPGACIASTYLGNGYSVGSGTSFASPLVAGAVALCIASGSCAGLTPAEIVDRFVADAGAYTSSDPAYGFGGDPSRPYDRWRHYGYLVNAGTY